MKIFDLTNDTSENIFLHFYSNRMINERLQLEAQFHFKYYLTEMSCSHSKKRLESVPLKRNFGKSYIKKIIHWIVATKALARFGIVTLSNTALFSIETILYETKNIFCSTNY